MSSPAQQSNKNSKKKIFNATNEDQNNILHELAFSKSSVLIEYIKKLDKEIEVDLAAKNKGGYTYTGIQDNIVRLAKEKEDNEKMKREIIRQEKKRRAEERRKEEEEEMIQKEKEEESEEKKREFGLTLLKYRGWIFLGIFSVFMIMLFIFVNNAANKKKEFIIA